LHGCRRKIRQCADLQLTRPRPGGIFGIPIEDRLSMPIRSALATAACALGADAGARGGFGIITTIITTTTRMRGASG
jgi:hypothetical protein